MAIKIGTSVDGKESKKRNYFSLKKGDNVYRILPPLFDLAEKGRWSMFYKIEYGYKDSEGRLRPFQDVRYINPKTKMVEVESAAHLKRESLKNALKDLKDRNAPKADIEKLVELIKNYNLDSKHYMNVIDQNGNIGLLKIPYTSKQALDAEIEIFKNKGIDPRGVDTGIFFIFNKTGEGLNTTYTVRPLKETIDVPGIGRVERDVYHKLTDEIIARLETEAFKLDTLFPKITPEEVERIVKEGVKAVDEIFGVDAKKTQGNTQEAVKPTASETKTTVQAVQPQVVQQVRSEPVQATPAVAANIPVATQPEPSYESEEDFLRDIGAIV